MSLQIVKNFITSILMYLNRSYMFSKLLVMVFQHALLDRHFPFENFQVSLMSNFLQTNRLLRIMAEALFLMELVK